MATGETEPLAEHPIPDKGQGRTGKADPLAANCLHPKRNTRENLGYYGELSSFLGAHDADPLTLMQGFAKYVPRQTLTDFLVRYEIFKQIVEVPGSVVECGVFRGQGLMSCAQFSAILEPVHFARKVIGFDTFVTAAMSPFA